MTTETAADPAIAATGLHKSFGGVAALADFSISVARAEIRCIVGPNGAGKSTLFKVLAGLTTPDAGRVAVLGQDVTRRDPRIIARLGVATKLQIPRVFPTLTVAEHLALASRAQMGVASLMGVRRRQRATEADADVERLLADHDLAALRDRPGDALSHGQRQWLEIVMLLATRPRVLLLDEPGAGMSVDDKARTAELIRRLGNDIAVIVIEHDLAFVQLIAHRVMVMHRGRLLTEGTFDEIASDPQVRLVYLGSDEE